jgi:hypothetical protein
MAKIVVRCQYTGHYVFTGVDARYATAGGRIFCPYCVAEHVWAASEARIDELRRDNNKPLVRQAS